MFRLECCVFLVISLVIFECKSQEYDFAAEIKRQCLVPDPVGLLDCVENKVTLPYVTSWVDCTNSLGQNVQTSADIINYRCKSVWEGKDVIPEVFYIKDCVIEKTGLPAKNVSAEVLGAYKECESGAQNPTQQQRIKTAPNQQQQLRASSVEYRPPTQQVQPPQQPIQQVQAQSPIQPQNFGVRQQFQTPTPRPVIIQGPIQQVFQAPAPRPVQQSPVIVQRPTQQQYQGPPRPVQQQYQAPVPRPVQQQYQAPAPRPVQQVPAPLLVQQQYQAPAPRPIQQQYQAPAPRPIQQQYQALVPRPIQQTQIRPPVQAVPLQLTQQQVPVSLNPQYPPISSGSQYQSPGTRQQYAGARPASPASVTQRQPYSQQFFAIYPQAPVPNQQQILNQPFLSQKTAFSPSYVSQQQIDSARTSNTINPVPNVPYSYSFQINHPQRPAF